MPTRHNKSASSSRRKSYSDNVKRQAVHDIVFKRQTRASVVRRLRCSPNTIAAWIKRFRHEFEPAASLPAFAPVSIVPNRDFTELQMPGGIILRLSAEMPVPQLAELLLLLARQC